MEALSGQLWVRTSGLARARDEQSARKLYCVLNIETSRRATTIKMARWTSLKDKGNDFMSPITLRMTLAKESF